MASFMTDLLNSIFTPGPTPTLLVATNASFAALQLLFAVLLIATYSIHFLVLSFLSGALWWSINWFASELQEAKNKEKAAEELRTAKQRQSQANQSSEDTETEGDTVSRSMAAKRVGSSTTQSEGKGDLRKRRSLGDGVGETSTEDEWEKVSEVGSRDAEHLN